MSINKSKRHKFGWEIRPSFSVSQNRDRAKVLQLWQRQLGCGSIRPDNSDKTLKFEVRSLGELITRVVPHFEEYPLLSEKKVDWERFADVCRMMSAREHLTREGFQKILRIAGEINRSGKKKFLREEIKI